MSTLTMSRAQAVLETRTAPIRATAAELRAAGDSEPRFYGRAIVYNERTAIGNPASWGWYEEIAPGCASKTLQESDVRFLVDHESAKVVSRTSAGTLTLTDTASALEVDSAMNTAKTYVADLAENLRDGSITGMSFGFYVVKDEWTRETVTVVNDQGVEAQLEVDVRRILEIRLVEVSAVTFPAYDATEAGLRSMCDEVRSVVGRRAVATCICENGACHCIEGTCVCPTDMCSCPTTPACPGSPGLGADKKSLPAPASGEDREPGETTRGSNDDEPAAATRTVEALNQRMRSRAARTGLPMPSAATE